MNCVQPVNVSAVPPPCGTVIPSRPRAADRFQRRHAGAGAGVVTTSASSTSSYGGKTPMPTGTVKWFSDEKGFGFITPDEGSRDLFVHHSSIQADGYRSLAEGAKVSYEEEAGPKGPKAINVRRSRLAVAGPGCASAGRAPAVTHDRLGHHLIAGYCRRHAGARGGHLQLGAVSQPFRPGGRGSLLAGVRPVLIPSREDDPARAGPFRRRPAAARSRAWRGDRGRRRCLPGHGPA